MRVLLWIVGGLVALGGGGLGWAIVEDALPIPSVCAKHSLERQPVNDLTARIRMANLGGDASVRVCAFTTRGGIKVYDDMLQVPVGPERVFYAALPTSTTYLHFEIGPKSTRSMGALWGQCPSKAFEVLIEYAETTAGSGDQSCTSAPAPGQPLRQGSQTAGPGGRLRLSTAGALGGFTVVGALYLALVRYRAPLAFVIAGFFSRLVKPELLDQRVRSRIHQIVGQEPGIHTSELQRRLEVGNGHLAHHLRILERERLVTRLGGPFFHHYFVTGKFQPVEMRRLAALRDPSLRLLSVLVRARPGQPLGALAAEAHFTMPRASRTAKRLVRAGLATAQRDGRELRLYPAA